MNPIRSVCVYCGSQPGRDSAYITAGRRLGQAMAENHLHLVYGGGTKGIMGAVCEGALQAGGAVTGIIPRFLMNKEATENALGRLSELVVTENMHERKHIMFEKSDAFVALPGGIGTVEEIVEIMTWAQLGHHRKPIVFGNVNGFWNPMMALMEHMAAEGFIHTAQRVQPLVVDDPEAIVAAILTAASTNGISAEGDEAVLGKL